MLVNKLPELRQYRKEVAQCWAKNKARYRMRDNVFAALCALAIFLMSEPFHTLDKDGVHGWHEFTASVFVGDLQKWVMLSLTAVTFWFLKHPSQTMLKLKICEYYFQDSVYIYSRFLQLSNCFRNPSSGIVYWFHISSTIFMTKYITFWNQNRI